MQHLQEANLAWSLIEAAKPELAPRERNHVFVSVGAGDSFTAIRILLKLIADKQIPLSPRMVQRCTTWLEAYALHEDHERLQLNIDGLKVTAAGRKPRAIVRSLTCKRNSAALAIAADAHHDLGVAARAG
ncbi:hypothetical protein [Mycobacterium sp. OTB74]|jgi:hypothetical protein|uniref:hypothetical protein n=1 Tax=Mycobacterium sp. OTB74 TaxID=1853452 RepID=UPI002473304B|nr:hypothetical protein [Mycobacterium sp. OTB74]MDH6242651.1 hypothetical protein [Mycobacterium sp. OTB74]